MLCSKVDDSRARAGAGVGLYFPPVKICESIRAAAAAMRRGASQSASTQSLLRCRSDW